MQLEDLFDIAKKDALSMSNNKKKKKIMIAHRNQSQASTLSNMHKKKNREKRVMKRDCVNTKFITKRARIDLSSSASS